MTFLVMILQRMMKGVDVCFAGAAHHARLRKVRRYAKGTASAPLAVGTVANTMHGGLRIDRDRCLPAGAGRCFFHEDLVMRRIQITHREELFVGYIGKTSLSDLTTPSDLAIQPANPNTTLRVVALFFSIFVTTTAPISDVLATCVPPQG